MLYHFYENQKICGDCFCVILSIHKPSLESCEVEVPKKGLLQSEIDFLPLIDKIEISEIHRKSVFRIKKKFKVNN